MEPQPIIFSDISDKPFTKVIACYSVYNEAKLIRSSIDSIKHYVDEIFVSDGAYRINKLSDDKTGEIIDDCLVGISYTDNKPESLLWLNRSGLSEIEKRNELYARVPEGEWIFIIDGDEVCVGDVKKAIEEVKRCSLDVCLIKVFNNGKGWTWSPRFIRAKKNFRLGPNHWTYNYGDKVIYDESGIHVQSLEITDFFMINCNVLRGKERMDQDAVYREFMSARNWDETKKDLVEVKA